MAIYNPLDFRKRSTNTATPPPTVTNRKLDIPGVGLQGGGVSINPAIASIKSTGTMTSGKPFDPNSVPTFRQEVADLYDKNMQDFYNKGLALPVTGLGSTSLKISKAKGNAVSKGSADAKVGQAIGDWWKRFKGEDMPGGTKKVVIPTPTATPTSVPIAAKVPAIAAIGETIKNKAKKIIGFGTIFAAGLIGNGIYRDNAIAKAKAEAEAMTGATAPTTGYVAPPIDNTPSVFDTGSEGTGTNVDNITGSISQPTDEVKGVTSGGVTNDVATNETTQKNSDIQNNARGTSGTTTADTNQQSGGGRPTGSAATPTATATPTTGGVVSDQVSQASLNEQALEQEAYNNMKQKTSPQETEQQFKEKHAIALLSRGFSIDEVKAQLDEWDKRNKPTYEQASPTQILQGKVSQEGLQPGVQGMQDSALQQMQRLGLQPPKGMQFIQQPGAGQSQPTATEQPGVTTEGQPGASNENYSVNFTSPNQQQWNENYNKSVTVNTPYQTPEQKTQAAIDNLGTGQAGKEYYVNDKGQVTYNRIDSSTSTAGTEYASKLINNFSQYKKPGSGVGMGIDFGIGLDDLDSFVGVVLNMSDRYPVGAKALSDILEQYKVGDKATQEDALARLKMQAGLVATAIRSDMYSVSGTAAYGNSIYTLAGTIENGAATVRNYYDKGFEDIKAEVSQYTRPQTTYVPTTLQDDSGRMKDILRKNPAYMQLLEKVRSQDETLYKQLSYDFNSDKLTGTEEKLIRAFNTDTFQPMKLAYDDYKSKYGYAAAQLAYPTYTMMSELVYLPNRKLIDDVVDSIDLSIPGLTGTQNQFIGNNVSGYGTSNKSYNKPYDGTTTGGGTSGGTREAYNYQSTSNIGNSFSGIS